MIILLDIKTDDDMKNYDKLSIIAIVINTMKFPSYHRRFVISEAMVYANLGRKFEFVIFCLLDYTPNTVKHTEENTVFIQHFTLGSNTLSKC